MFFRDVYKIVQIEESKQLLTTYIREAAHPMSWNIKVGEGVQGKLFLVR